MNRLEYMRELEALLSDVPIEEREDAINYYNDYFNAGGEENEEATIKALGSPEELAKTIKLASKSENLEDGEFTETGYVESGRANENGLDKYGVPVRYKSTGSKQENNKRGGGLTILFIVCAVFAFPIIVPIAIGLLAAAFGIAIAIICSLIGIAIAIMAAGLGALIGGVAGIVAGILAIATNPFGGLTLRGVFCITLALGLEFCMGVVKIIGAVLPPAFRGVIALLRMPIDWIAGKINSRKGDNI